MPVPPELVAATGQAVRLGLHSVRSGRTLAGMPTVLLEVAAYAAEDRARLGESLQTTLIIDQSAAGDPRGWSRICRGLVALARHVGPADTTTVILCGPRPRVAVRDADPATLMAAASSWESLPAAASADLDAAFELVTVERLAESRSGTVVVAHGVTLDRGRTHVREALAEWHRALAVDDGDSLASGPRPGIRFIVIDPTAAAASRGRRTDLWPDRPRRHGNPSRPDPAGHRPRHPGGQAMPARGAIRPRPGLPLPDRGSPPDGH